MAAGGGVNYLRTTISKASIEKISFTNTIVGHESNGTDCWDVSKNQTKTVLAWATDNDNNGKYELTIGSNGKVFAYSGSYLFSGLTNLTTIDGMQYFDTSQVTNMSFMFSECKALESLDLSHFKTSKVTNMRYIFNYCFELTTLDLSSFDTSNVIDMIGMFS